MEYENEVVFINGKKLTKLSEVPWKPHSQFKGVYLKNVIADEDCDNYLKAVMVRVEPACSLENHIHNGMAELHEVISGQGVAIIGKNTVVYTPGVVSFIPADVEHSVTASDSELVLNAKFIRK